MKALCRIAVVTLICLAAATAFAQTTTYAVPPTACQTYAANYSCEFSIATFPNGPSEVFYEPRYGSRFDVLEFFAPLNLGIAYVTSVTTSAPTLVSSTGMPGRQNYVAVNLYSEQTTFAGDGYTGSSSLIYTVTTRCCGSGRGAGQKSVWSINSGSLTIMQ